jgi:abortive infection bacteriophage resistance protein
MKYDKPALSIEQQIDQLLKRGMTFGDPARAAHFLRELNYYRLSGYWLRREADHATHRFQPGTTFEDVLADYVFDRELKLLVLDAVERIEVSVRTHWAHQLGLRHGAHAHLDSILFKDRSQQWNHSRAVASLVGDVEKSTEIFIRHLRSQYDELLPPIWAAVEVMTLGQISRWYDNLRHATDRKAVALGYELDEALLASFLHHISIVRNVCAHHSRLWDRDLPFKARLPRKNPQDLAESLNHKSPRHLYNTLTMLGWLLDKISPAQTWVSRVARHVNDHPPATGIMGFPNDYQNSAVWRHTPAGIKPA